MDPSLYNPVMMPNKFSYIEEAGAKAKQEKQQAATPWAAAIGGTLGAIAGSVIPGLGTAVGASVGSALGGAAGSLFGGGAQADAEAQAEEEYGQMYAYEMADRNQAIADAMASARQDAYLSEIQNMRKNVMPNRTEYLKFV
jgi:phage tail tape-measure protein